MSVCDFFSNPPVPVSQYKKILKGGEDVIEFLVRQSYFDPDRPEYHNIYCSDIENKTIYVYMDGIWIPAKYEFIIQMVILKSFLDLADVFRVDYIRTLKKVNEVASMGAYDMYSESDEHKSRILKILYKNRKMAIDNPLLQQTVKHSSSKKSKTKKGDHIENNSDIDEKESLYINMKEALMKKRIKTKKQIHSEDDSEEDIETSPTTKIKRKQKGTTYIKTNLDRSDESPKRKTKTKSRIK